MLNIEEIRTLLEPVTYKPGWTFEVYYHQFEGPHILIQTFMPNSYNPDEEVALGIRSALPPMEDEFQLYEWLAWRLGRIENHEMREWFKVNGKPYSDPHETGEGE